MCKRGKGRKWSKEKATTKKKSSDFFRDKMENFRAKCAVMNFS